MSRSAWVVAGLGFLAALLMGQQVASATTFQRIPLWELLEGADFVGIVECDTAGGIVAKYRALEVWKGDVAVGSLVNIRSSVNYWGQQFPITLCGQRFIVVGYHGHAPSRITSMSGHGPVPLWWRQIPVDFRLPFFQGLREIKELPGRDDENRPRRSRSEAYADRVKEYVSAAPREQERSRFAWTVDEMRMAGLPYRSDISADLSRRLSETSSYDELAALVNAHKPLDEFHLGRAHESLLELIDIAQESSASARVREGLQLRSLVTRARMYLRNWQMEKDYASWQRLQKRGEDSQVVDQVLALLAELHRQGDEHRKASIEETIMKLGGPATREALEKAPEGGDSPWKKEVRERLVRALRTGKVLPRPEPPAPPREEPKKDGRIKAEKIEVIRLEPRPLKSLDELRQIFRKGDESGFEFHEAFEALTEKDPDIVVEYLLQAWKEPGSRWDHDRMYALGSWFAHHCGKDRRKHLTALLEARDPWIRVAGAVYLCFEDPFAGKQHLRELTKLDGDPGVWAALTLARRGDDTSLERLLKVFESYGEQNMSGSLCRVFQARVRVLLSNSAKASGVDQPPPPLPRNNSDPQPAEVAKMYEYYLQWWRENRRGLVLVDPWMEILSEQKID
jgi:hypothetical protein